MTTMVRLRTVCALAALAACVGATLSVTAGQGRGSDTLEERIRRVENGLLPAVVIKGEPLTGLKLADRMDRHKTPGVSIAVIDDGALDWARGYGVRETGGTDVVTPRTLFQAASISKPVAAVAALRLVEAGRLELDAEVNAKLVSWKVPDNDLTKERKVTLGGVLSHTAGLTVHGYPGYAANRPVPTLVQVLEGVSPSNTAPTRVDIVPGGRWRYAGGGFSVMQQLLIDVTGQPFPELMRETVLRQAGMSDSTYEQPLGAQWRTRAAAGHDARGTVIEGRSHTYPEMAAAGLWTTPSDLARFAIELQQAAAGRSNRLLSSAMAKRMLTPGIGDWGLGLQVRGSGQTTRFSHGGANAGFRATLVAYAEAGRGAVVLTNSDSGGALAEEILRGIAREYGWPDYAPREKILATLDTGVLDAYAGVYELRPALRITVSREASTLVAEADGQRFELRPESETSFFTLTSPLEVRFVKDAAGRVTHLVLNGDAQARRIR